MDGRNQKQGHKMGREDEVSTKRETNPAQMRSFTMFSKQDTEANAHGNIGAASRRQLRAYCDSELHAETVPGNIRPRVPRSMIGGCHNSPNWYCKENSALDEHEELRGVRAAGVAGQ
jgi:hypothetical protein